MLFAGLTLIKTVVKMTVNTRKIIMICGSQSSANRGVLCTNDAELHILMLTCPRQT